MSQTIKNSNTQDLKEKTAEVNLAFIQYTINAKKLHSFPIKAVSDELQSYAPFEKLYDIYVNSIQQARNVSSDWLVDVGPMLAGTIEQQILQAANINKKITIELREYANMPSLTPLQIKKFEALVSYLRKNIRRKVEKFKEIYTPQSEDSPATGILPTYTTRVKEAYLSVKNVEDEQQRVTQTSDDKIKQLVQRRDDLNIRKGQLARQIDESDSYLNIFQKVTNILGFTNYRLKSEFTDEYEQTIRDLDKEMSTLNLQEKLCFFITATKDDLHELEQTLSQMSTGIGEITGIFTSIDITLGEVYEKLENTSQNIEDSASEDLDKALESELAMMYDASFAADNWQSLVDYVSKIDFGKDLNQALIDQEYNIEDNDDVLMALF